MTRSGDHCTLRGVRELLFRRCSEWIERSQRSTLLVVAVTFLLAVAWLATGHLGFNASRHGIVTEEDPEQRKLLNFGQRFGAANDVVVVLMGEDPVALRATADAAAPALRAAPYVDEVFYHVDLDAMGDHAIYYLDTERLDRLQGLLEALVPRLPERTPEQEPTVVHGLRDGLTQVNDAIEEFVNGETGGLGGEAVPVAQVRDGARLVAGLFDEAAAWVREDRRRFSLETDLRNGGGQGLALDEAGYLVADEGRILLIRIGSRSDVLDDNYARPMLEAVNAALEAHAAPSVHWGIAGVPAMVVDEQDAMKRDLPLTSSISVVGCLFIFFLAYRNLRATALILLPLALGMAWALGLTAVTVGHLNLLTNAMAVILVGMGIDFGVHLYTRIRDERATGQGAAEAVHRAMSHTGPAILTGAFTSAAAFATMAFTGFRALTELGIIASIGLIAMMLATFVAFPLVFFRRQQSPSVAPPPVHTSFRFPSRLVWPILGCSLVVSVFLALQIKPVRFNMDLDVLLPRDAPSRQTLETLKERDVPGFEFAAMELNSLEETAARLKALNGSTDLQPLSQRVESIFDILPPDLAEKHERVATLRELGRQLPPVSMKVDPAFDLAALKGELERFIEGLESDLPFTLRSLGRGDLSAELQPVLAAARDLQDALSTVEAETSSRRLSAFEARSEDLISRLEPTLRQAHQPLTPALLPRDLTGPFYQQIDGKEWFAIRIYPAGDPANPAFSEQFRSALRAIDTGVTGYAVTYAYFGGLMQEGFRQATLWAALVVLLLVGLDLRSIRDAIFALVPLAIGGFWMVGLMNLLGIGYSFANVVSIPLIIGIGIDSGIHLLHRWRETGHNVHASVTSTGRAILVSSLTTTTAFGALMLSSHGGAASLGQTLLIGVLTCLVASLVVLPALLLAVQNRLA